MFYIDRIVSIGPNDKVLDVGPGADPHPKATTLLEIKASEEELAAQRGYTKLKPTNKETVFYDGKVFPFKKNEFNYVICAHVLEHVEDVEGFYNQLTKVANKGYLEFPTIYYEYLYNFDVHLNILRFDEESNTIFYIKKSDLGLDEFACVHKLFYESLTKGYVDLVNDLQPFMFQGFEWNNSNLPKIVKAQSLNDLVYKNVSLNLKMANENCENTENSNLDNSMQPVKNIKSYANIINKFIRRIFK